MPACKQCTKDVHQVGRNGLCAECRGEIVTFESPSVRVVADKTGRIKRIERRAATDET